jgi:RNase P protein component
VREVFRTNRALFPQGSDVVVIAKAGAYAQSYRDVYGEMESASGALRKAGDRARRQGGAA